MEPAVRLERIRDRMRELNIRSARQLALLAGSDNVSVSKVLAGDRPQVAVATVAQLAAALQVSVDYLLGNTDEPTGTSIAMPASGEALLRAIERLPVNRRPEVVDIVHVLADAEEKRAEHSAAMQRALGMLEALAPPGQYEELLTILESAAGTGDILGARRRIAALLAAEE